MTHIAQNEIEKIITDLAADGFVLRGSDGNELNCINISGKALTVAWRETLRLRRAELLEFCKDQVFPLSFAQQRLWFLDQYEESNVGSYNVPLVFHLEGDLRVDILQCSFDILIARHASLRTSFIARRGTAVQQISAPYKIELPVINIGQAELENLLTFEISRPFSLHNDHLLRVKLFKLGEKSYALLINQHHIITDGWSVGIMLRDLSEIYSALLNNEIPKISELKVEYVDFSCWQHNLINSEKFKKQCAYWREQLDNVVDLAVPTDFPRPPIQTYNGKRHRFLLEKNLSVNLQQLAQRAQCTLFMLLLTAFYVLLGRYSNQNDIVIGTPVAGRTHKVFSGILGFFVNTLALRCNLRAEQTFLHALNVVREMCLAAYDNQDVPFELVVDMLHVVRNPSVTPLFKVMFEVHAGDQMVWPDFPKIKATPLPITYDIAKFDLTLSLIAANDGLLGEVEYNTDLYCTDTAINLACHYERLLRQIADNPQITLAQFSLLSDAEYQQVTRAWNVTDAVLPNKHIVHELFEEQVKRTPNNIAVEFCDASVSYSQLNAHANQLAHALRDKFRSCSLGVQSTKDVKCGLLIERGCNMLIGLLGILKAEMVYVPLSSDLPKMRIQQIISDVNLNVLLTTRETARTIPWLGELISCTVIFLDEIVQKPNEAIHSNPEITTTPSGLAYILYTSGSSGIPKGVMVEHGSFLNAVYARFLEFEGAPQKFLSIYDLTFDASLAGIFWTLLSGGCLFIADKTILREAALFLDYIAQQRITHLDCTPSFYKMMLRNSTAEKLQSLQLVIVGGEACDMQLVAQHYQTCSAQLINEYGPTEACIWATYRKILPHDVHLTIGKPIKNVRVYVLHQESLALQPIGIPGELCIGGLNVARGYWQQKQLTAEKFITDPFSGTENARLYRTGDLVRWLPSGELEYLGRIDGQVKIRGFRIELGDIEAVLLRHEKIAQAVVVVQEHPEHKRLVAYVVSTTSQAVLNKDELQTYLRENLPEYMVPQHYVALPALPLKSSGKIDKNMLPKPDDADYLNLNSPGYAAAKSQVEQQLADIWCAVLHLDHVGIHDNFFASGGDSIMSIQVIARAREQGLNLSAKRLFAHPTIYELAQLVQNVDKTSTLANSTQRAQAMDDNDITGHADLAPIQHWFFKQNFPAMSHYNQAVLLRLSNDLKLSREQLSIIVQALVQRHDTLRLRFKYDPERGWQQYYVPQSAMSVLPIFLREIKESAETATSSQSLIESFCNEAQASLNIELGPLFRFVLITESADILRQRLFIVVHHLLIDGVSWRILLRDLAGLIQSSGETIAEKFRYFSMSYKKWQKNLLEYAISSKLDAEFRFWEGLTHKVQKQGSMCLPLEQPGCEVREQDCAAFRFEFAERETADLLTRVHHAYHTKIEDFLLAALLLASLELCGYKKKYLFINLESHGREEIYPGIDVAHTLGWFTSVYPVCLHLPDNLLNLRDEALLSAVLKTTKEQLRTIPNKGIGFGVLRYLGTIEQQQKLMALDDAAQVGFNYLGRMDEIGAATDLGHQPFTIEQTDIGQCAARENQVAHLLELNGFILAKKLQFNVTYSTKHFKPKTIALFCRAYKSHLEQLLAHCLRVTKSYFTPSDFPHAKIPQLILDELEKRYEIERIYGLSPLQKGMLFHALYGDSHSQYCNQVAWDYIGAVDEATLQQAWREMILRHAVLRTSFHYQDLDEPAQIVHRDLKLPWFRKDFSDLAQDEQSAAIAKYTCADHKLGFDLTTPGLLRLHWLRLSHEHHRFLWTDHHIILDGWCMPLLFDEVHGRYRALMLGRTQSWKAIPPYENYIAWLQQQDIGEAENFWRDFLSGFSVPTDLVINHKKLNIHAAVSNFQEEYLSLSPELTEKCRALAKQSLVTLNTVLQLAYAKVLACYSGEDSVLFGTTVSGRPAELPDIEHMIGLFINALPLRVDLGLNKNIITQLQEVQSAMRKVEQYGFLDLTAIQKETRITQELPLFYSIFIFESYPLGSGNTTPDAAMADIGYRIENISSHERTNYPLTVEILPGANYLTVKAVYDADCFSEELISRMLQHMQQVLSLMVKDPTCVLASVPLLTTDEYRQIVYDFNDTTRYFPQDRNFSELFAEQVARTPNNIAVLCGGKKITYAELAEKSRELAVYLREAGIIAGDVVGVYLERSYEFLRSMLAIFNCNAAYLPFDVEYPVARNAQIITQSKIKFIVSDSALQKNLAEVVKQVDISIAPLMLILDCLEIRGLRDASIANTSDPNCAAHNLAYVIYTSGSTGVPKGVMIEQRGMINHLYAKVHDLKLTSSDIIIQNASQCFDISTWQFLAALLVGGTTLIVNNAIAHDASQLLDEVRANRASILEIVPSMFKMMLAEIKTHSQRDHFPNLRWMILTGEALPPRLCQEWFEYYPQIPLLNAYGPTECSDDVTHYPIYAAPDDSILHMPIGKPVANMQLYVLDKDLMPVPLGIVGELYVAGVGVGRGYMHDAEKTAAAFLPNPFDKRNAARLYRTGDLARLLPCGNLEYLGRANSQVKIRGFRIELEEIEAVLAKHALIKECVVAVLEVAGEQMLVAYVVRRAIDEVGAEDLSMYLSQHFPYYMVPQIFMFLDQLPITGNGKIDRKILPHPDAADIKKHSVYREPGTQEQKLIAAIWCEVLNVECVGLDDNFFRLGGNSLHAMRVIAKLYTTFGLKLPVGIVFQHPLLHQLAEHVLGLYAPNFDDMSLEEI